MLNPSLPLLDIANSCQMKAVKRFKNLLTRKRPEGMEGILGKDTRMVQPPLSIERPENPSLHRTRSVDIHDRRPLEQALVSEGIHRDVDLDHYEKTLPEREDTAVTFSSKSSAKRPSDHDNDDTLTSPLSSKRALNAKPQDHRSTYPQPTRQSTAHGGKGQAHDPLDDQLYLALGPGGSSLPPSPPAVSESPPAADSNIYETAYHLEIERLRSKEGESTTLFLNRRVEGKEEYQKDESLVKGDSTGGGGSSKPRNGLARVLDQARMKAAKGAQYDHNGAARDDDRGTADKQRGVAS